MTWNVQFEGQSKQGPDNQQQHEYLKKVFNEAMLKIKSEGIITLQRARLTTDQSEYDFVSQKDATPVGANKSTSTGTSGGVSNS